MPVLQWSLLFVLSLLLSLLFLLIHLPGPLLLGSMIVGIIFSLRGISLHPPRCTFLGAQAILGCMIAQNLTGSIFTTLAAHWPMVIVILLATLISSAIIGWLLVRYSTLPGNTGAWGSSPGGAAAMVAMAQDYGADIRLVAFMQYLRVLLVSASKRQSFQHSDAGRRCRHGWTLTAYSLWRHAIADAGGCLAECKRSDGD